MSKAYEIKYTIAYTFALFNLGAAINVLGPAIPILAIEQKVDEDKLG